MELKDQLVTLLMKGWEMEQALIAGLSEPEREAIGALDCWSAKDMIAHIAAWNERLAQAVEGSSRGVSPAPIEDLDRHNAEIFEKNRDRSWDDVFHFAEESHRAMIEQLQPLDESALRDTEWLPWLEGRPLWRRFVGNGYLHVLMHIASFLASRGEVARVAQLYEEAAALLNPLDDSPSWRGLNCYNIACGYALAGQKERAIQKLGEALQTNPELIPWSKEDPDLESLRSEPAYQALYGN